MSVWRSFFVSVRQKPSKSLLKPYKFEQCMVARCASLTSWTLFWSCLDTPLGPLLLHIHSSYASFEVRSMTDAERDQVDGNAQAVMRSCGEEIRLFRSDLTRLKLRPQVEEHRSITITMIDTYMKVVCKIFSEMKGKARHRQHNFIIFTFTTKRRRY